jgi:hypothetical protein
MVLYRIVVDPVGGRVAAVVDDAGEDLPVGGEREVDRAVARVVDRRTLEGGVA